MNAGVPICDKSKKDIIACIDFGSYGTSYAFAIADNAITVETTWADNDGSYFKNPTQALYNLAGKQLAIGFSAQVIYGNFEEDEAIDHALIGDFKLGLYNNPTNHVTDPVSGRKFNVVDLISKYIASIHEQMLAKLNTVSTYVVDRQRIRYVITVPAIWSDNAVSVMRQALVNANIIEPQSGEADCLFVLEPEAASVYCMEKKDSLGLSAFPDGLVYMVVDAGGGTVDITIHKIEQNKIKEVTVRNGGVCGSMSIDKKFFKWLSSCFQPGTVDDMFKSSPYNYYSLRSAWEKFKINCKNFDKTQMISAPEGIKELVNDSQLLPECTDIVKRDRIHLSVSIQKDIFEEALATISFLVDQQLTRSPLTVKYIFLVGGFGQCPHLHKRLQDNFETTNRVEKVLQPTNGGQAIVIGGVLLGKDPSRIRSRIARQTYGIEVEEVFDELIHDEERLVARGSLFLCTGVFHSFVTTGQEVGAEAIIERKFDTSGGETRIVIYTSPMKQVHYVNDKHVVKLGELIVPPPDPLATDKSFVLVRFKFGEIGFNVEAIDHLGNKTRSQVEYSLSTTFKEHV